MESGGDRESVWDKENRLEEGSFQGDPVSFVYDGDGELVRKTASGQTTLYAGPHYDHNMGSGERRRYYFFGNQRVAMHSGTTLYFLHSDHLGSTSLATDESGNEVPDSLLRYFPYGGSRMGSEADAPTDYLFTGERREQNLGGLFHMGARFYHPGLGRWISADTIVPDPTRPQDLNRYSYVLNSPLKYIDPSGHSRPMPIIDWEVDISNWIGLGKGLAVVVCAVGVCHVDWEQEIVRSLTASEMEEQMTYNLVGIANPIGMVSVADDVARIGGKGSTRLFRKLGINFQKLGGYGEDVLTKGFTWIPPLVR